MMIKINNKDIKGIALGDKKIIRVIRDDDVLFEDCFVIAGKFTDDSTSEDWWFHPNGDINKQTSLIDYVNPDTKEFVYTSSDKPNSVNSLFARNIAIERIYKLKGTENCISIEAAFGSCTSLLSVDLSKTDTSNCKKFNSIFYGANNIVDINLKGLDTSKAETLNLMFYQCRKLEHIDLSSFNTENCTNFSEIFSGCWKLKDSNISTFNTENANNIQYMFAQNYGITSIDISHFNTSKVTNFNRLFLECPYLQEIKLNLNFESAKSVNQIFYLSNALTTIIGTISNLSLSIDLSPCPLTNDSAMVFINGLADLDAPQTINFKDVTYDTLTPEQIAIATSKGWNVARGSTIVNPEEKFFIIEGKFTDDSTEDDWWLNDPDIYSPTKVSIVDLVDPNTKEFKYILNHAPIYCSDIFWDNTAIENVSIKGATRPNTAFYRCFAVCTALKQVSFPSTTIVARCFSMFQNCTSLEHLDLSNCDMRTADAIYQMFTGCHNLKSIKLGENTYTEKPINNIGIWGNCWSLENIDTTLVRDVSTCNNFTRIFDNCKTITTLDISHFATSQVTTFNYMFEHCNNLIELRCNLDFSSATSTESMFSNCTSLTDIKGSISNLSVSIDLHYSPLTNESAMLFINALTEVEETQTITFNATTYDTLTEEQIAIATSKGWDVLRVES